MHIVIVYRGRYHIKQALELETLSAVIRQAEHRVTLIYDPDVFGITDNVLQIPALAKRLSFHERMAQKIAEAYPDLVLFSALPNTYKWLRETAQKLKSLISVPVVFIGLHPTLAPERVMRDRFVDYVIQGEVEGVIHLFTAALKSHKDKNQVGNLWYRKNEQVLFTYRDDPVNLDTLPLPDKELFRPYVTHSYSYAAVVSRGCPFRCSFCEETCWKQIYGNRFFRRKSVDSVMRELIEAKHRYNFKEVIFKDSYLSGDIRWLERLMQEYRKNIAVPFKCFCAITGFDEKTAKLLKKSGCYCVEFGLQTWNEHIRRKALQRPESNKDAIHVFDLCARQRLWYDIDHMFNLPGETENDHITGALNYHSLRYLNRIKTHYLVYLPSAKIIDHALRTKTVSEDIHIQLENGWENDFYNQGIHDSNSRTSAAGFSVLYKLIPIIPGWLLHLFVSWKCPRWLRLIPSPIIAMLQGLMAVRSRDRRFLIYLRFYPAKVFTALCRKISGI